MTHIWYHQAGCELFAAWMPGYAGSLPLQVVIPDGFLQRCREKALEHARGTTQLIQKILKLEPDHLFRDAWFGLCVLDSTRVQIAGLESQNGYDLNGINEVVADYLNLHLRALNNTKKILPLAEKIVSQLNLMAIL